MQKAAHSYFLIFPILLLTSCSNSPVNDPSDTLKSVNTVLESDQSQPGESGQESYFFQDIELDCKNQPFTLPMKVECPETNRLELGDISHFSQSISIDSSQYGFARVRSDGIMNGDYFDNVLMELAHGQNFCGYGPVRIITDGATGPDGYRVLLKDTRGQYCLGYVHEPLAKVNLDDRKLELSF